MEETKTEGIANVENDDGGCAKKDAKTTGAPSDEDDPLDSKNWPAETTSYCRADHMAITGDPAEYDLIATILETEEQMRDGIRSALPHFDPRLAKVHLRIAFDSVKPLIGAVENLFEHRYGGTQTVQVVRGSKVGLAAKLERFRQPPENSPDWYLLKCLSSGIWRSIRGRLLAKQCHAQSAYDDPRDYGVPRRMRCSADDIELWGVLMAKAQRAVVALDKASIRLTRNGRQVIVVEGGKSHDARRAG